MPVKYRRCYSIAAVIFFPLWDEISLTTHILISPSLLREGAGG